MSSQLSATALGEKSLINRNEYLSEYSSEYSHKGHYSSQGEGFTNSRYGWNWWRYQKTLIRYNYTRANIKAKATKA